MTGLAFIVAGVVLLTAGSIALFGPIAALVAGVALIAAGALIDWEALQHDEHPAPPPV